MMKKIYLIIAVQVFVNLAFAQWAKINSVPSRHIVAFCVHNNSIYAACDSNVLFKSSDGGVVWNTTRLSNDRLDITSLFSYNNTIYVSTFNKGIFVSKDDGNTWQNDGRGPRWISELEVKDNVLYAATLGNGVARLDPNTNNWPTFNNSLPNYSVNVQRIISSPNFLLIAAGSNGTFYRYDFNGGNWNEEYYYGRYRPGLQINKLINSGDTIFAVNGNRIIRSNNAGLNWTDDKIGTRRGRDRMIYRGTNNYYTLTNLDPIGSVIQQRNTNAVTGTTWETNEEIFPDGYSYNIIEYNKNLFLGRTDGLYFKKLSAGTLPVHFIFFNVKCDESKITLNWKTAQEQNSDHFNIEKSVDGIEWSVIGNLAAAGNSNAEKNYLFADNNPNPASYYRIAAYDTDGKINYSGTERSSCNVKDIVSLWPNPVHDQAFISIVTGSQSRAFVKIFDSKGALVKMQSANILKGINQFSIDMRSLANGVYQLSVNWNNGQTKTVRVLKQ